MSSDEAKELCKQVTIGFSCIEVVYGEAGIYYIDVWNPAS